MTSLSEEFDWEKAGLRAADAADFGAAGDGIRDDSDALQRALDSGAQTVRIRRGAYRCAKTLRIHSHTHVEAHPQARLFMCGETPKFRRDFLLTNADPAGGNCDISVAGGIWDGNNTGRYNTKPDLFDSNGYSGSVLNFVNVRDLNLQDLVVANSVTYHIRMAMLDGFEIRRVGFRSEKPGFNQDGLHFGGCVRNGAVSDIAALSVGQTTDDMIALNADDSMERVENLDLIRGPIENVTFENISAADCYTFIRMLSVTAPIRNIRLAHIHGGCRMYAVNMDAARYCRTPLFRNEDCPGGVGVIENVEIADMAVHFTRKGIENPLIVCESNLHDLRMRNFSRDAALDQSPAAPVLGIRNVAHMTVRLEGLDPAPREAAGSARVCAEDGGRAARICLPDTSAEYSAGGTFSSLTAN